MLIILCYQPLCNQNAPLQYNSKYIEDTSYIREYKVKFAYPIAFTELNGEAELEIGHGRNIAALCSSNFFIGATSTFNRFTGVTYLFYLDLIKYCGVQRHADRIKENRIK